MRSPDWAERAATRRGGTRAQAKKGPSWRAVERRGDRAARFVVFGEACHCGGGEAEALVRLALEQSILHT